MNSTLQINSWFLFQNNSLENKTLDTHQGQDKSVDQDMERNMRIAQAFFIIIAFLGIFENSISILALRKSKELRSPTTAFIVNLCIADLIYCLLTPITYFRPELNQNNTLCRWNTMAKYFVSAESVNLMVAITINRFICVVYPKYYRLLYSLKYLAIQIALTWAYSLTLSLLPFFEGLGRYGYEPKIGLCTILGPSAKTFNYIFVISAFGFPTLAFIICYPIIFLVAHNASNRVKQFNLSTTPAMLNATSEEGRGKNTSSHLDDKEMKLLKVMLVILVSFIICYLPITYITMTGKPAPAFILIARFGINLSNVINPIIYIAMSAEFRKAYLELFQCTKIWSPSSTSANTESARV
ncbi:G-protein coupled receptor moody-like [Parasteatoda tepidariorum]|nr:G-protein coupled receptor moody-like [Parasteatoda tepidariorum]